MKIAITAAGPSLDDRVDPRFGRCAYFLFVDTETGAFEAVPNPNLSLGGGAGIQSAQLIAQRGAKAVLTGNCGPNAFAALQAAGVQVLTGVSGPVRQAVERFKAGAFSASSGPTVASHFGMGAGSAPDGAFGMEGGSMGRGMGRGLGRGGGRGMGRGWGRGMGQGAGMAGVTPGAPYPTPPAAGLSPEQELEILKAQAQAMNQHLHAIHERIAALEQGRRASGLVAVVDEENCVGCARCEEVCPTGAIAVDEVARVDASKCDGCGLCVPECPQEALSLRRA